MKKAPRKLNYVMMAGYRIKIRHVTEDELREEWGDWDEDQMVIRLLKSLVGKPAYVKWLRHEMRHAALTLGG